MRPTKTGAIDALNLDEEEASLLKTVYQYTQKTWLDKFSVSYIQDTLRELYIFISVDPVKRTPPNMGRFIFLRLKKGQQ